MDIKERVKLLENKVEMLMQKVTLLTNIDNVNSSNTFGVYQDLFNLIMNCGMILGTTAQLYFTGDVITSIVCSPLKFAIKANDKILVYNRILNTNTEYTASEDAVVGANSISITSQELKENIDGNSIIYFKLETGSDRHFNIIH